MKNKKWDALISEKVSQDHTDNIIRMAQVELKKKKTSAFSLSWMMPLAGSAVAAALVIFMMVPQFKEVANPEVALLNLEAEELENIDLLLDLEEVEELEEVELWQET